MYPTTQHPSTGIRRRADLLSTPHADCGMASDDHFVQFYDSEQCLVDSVAVFAHDGIADGEACLLIATPPHLRSVEAELRARGVDLSAAAARGAYTAANAEDILASFMDGDAPDPERFGRALGALVARAARSGTRVRAFGEMVALLWSDGRQDAAVRLEELWNDLATSHSLSLYCAYPLRAFDDDEHAAGFQRICNTHKHVIPAESYASLANDDARLREISRLQQKAAALEAKVQHNRALAADLARRERELSVLNARLQRLMTETHHRVKNNLQTISALIEMQALRYEESVPVSELKRLGSNVRALGVIHEILTQDARTGRLDCDRVSVLAVLTPLVSHLCDAARGVAITMQCDELYLQARKSTAVALVLNELVANAVKHGGAHCHISLAAQSDSAMLTVRDDGPGFPDDFDPKQSAHTGIELVENVVRWDLSGCVRYEAATTGAVVTVTFPLIGID